MDHSQHEQYRADSEWEVRQLRLELEAARKGEEYIRPPRYTGIQKGCSIIPKDKLVKDLLSSLNNLLTPTMEFNKEKKEWVGLTDKEKQDAYLKIDGWDNCVNFIEETLREKNNG